MPDPCHQCGGTIRFDSNVCPVCQAPVRRLTAAEREKRRRGPKIAAVLTLAAIGVLVIFADVAMVMVSGWLHRWNIYMGILGVACICGAGATWRDL